MPGQNLIPIVCLGLTILLMIQDHRYRNALDRIRQLENEIKRLKSEKP